MMLNPERHLANELRELYTDLWDTCSSGNWSFAEDLLAAITDNADELISDFEPLNPSAARLVRAWNNAAAAAADYLTSSERIDETLWFVGDRVRARRLPHELVVAFSELHFAIVASLTS
jgi:hypothetical protein